MSESLHILIVEDDPGDYRLVFSYLRLAGIVRSGDSESLLWAKSLSDGIALSERHVPDVVLLDLSLPDSSGLPTVHAMRTALPDTPIVVLTGNDNTDLALKAVEAGAQDYLVKGHFEQDALGRAIRHARVREKLEQQLLQHQRQLESVVAERTRELMAALEASQAANRAKSTFLANMSHEIRTPMHGILGLAALLGAEDTSPKQRQHLAKLESTAHHLMGLLNDILDISRIEAGKLTLDEGKFQPRGLLQEICAVIEPQARARGLFLEQRLDPDLPDWLIGDALRLKQILINLGGNAVKFTEQGGIVLAVRLERHDTAQVLLRFSVVDTGSGIAPNDQKRIFTPFEQADNSLTREHGGTGLGLTICQHLADLMNSRIELQSAPGKGSTFSFAVALRLVENEAQRGVPAGGDAPLALTGTRILVAEDDPLNQEIVLGLLEDQGVQADLAPDGGAAVELATRVPYDMILLDLHMPVMDGMEACRHIRQLPAHATTPIVALTADAFSSVHEQCLQAGMNDCISKPFDADQLCTMVRRWLHAKAVRRMTRPGE